MARWWSSTRKPSTSSGENDTTGTGRSEGASSASSSRLKRTLFRSHRPKKEEAASTAAVPRDLEPPPPPFASRPFTQQNLEHQKILGAFTWTTAAGGAGGAGGRRPRKPSRGAHSYASGVSPSTSRTTSVDDTAGPPYAAACPPRSPTRAPADRRSLSGRLRRSLAAAVDGPSRESLSGSGGSGGGESEQGHVPIAVLPGGVSDAHRRS